MNDANKSEATKIEEATSEEPPPKSDSKEMLKISGGRYSDNVLLKSYVLCSRNFVGQRRLALLSLYGDNNVLKRSNIGN